MLVPPLHEGPSPGSPSVADWGPPGRDDAPGWLGPLAAWGVFGQLAACVVCCTGAASDAPVLLVIGMMVLLTAVVSAGFAAGIALRHCRELPVLTVAGGLVPWGIVCGEATVVLYAMLGWG